MRSDDIDEKGAFMAGLFGTDGVRARINTGSMTAEAVVRLALAAGRRPRVAGCLPAVALSTPRT